MDSFIAQLHQSDTELTVQPVSASTTVISDTAGLPDVQQPQESDEQEVEEPQKPKQPTGYVQLSKELAVAHSKDSIILVTWTNLHFLDFVENWITHLLELGTLPPAQCDSCRCVHGLLKQSVLQICWQPLYTH